MPVLPPGQNTRLTALRSSLALPDRREEPWRKLDLSGLRLTELPGINRQHLSGAAGRVEVNGPALEVVQGADFWKDETFSGAPRFADSMRQHSLAELYLLNPEGALFLSAVDGTLLLNHRRGDLPWLAPSLVIRVNPGAHLRIVEELETEPLQLQCPVTDLEVGAGARVEYLVLSHPSQGCYYFHNWQAMLHRDSQLEIKYYHGGGLRGKNYYRTHLLEPGSSTRVTALASGAGREVTDLHMLMEHHASHTDSTIDYRTVLDDQAHGIFNGNLFIDHGLKAVNSRQTNRNIVLGPRARAESMPNLIIKAESVSCEHGATVGQLDPGALFYLMSRGLTEAEARSTLVHGFLDESLSQFPAEYQESIQDSIRNRIHT